MFYAKRFVPKSIEAIDVQIAGMKGLITSDAQANWLNLRSSEFTKASSTPGPQQ
jgi:hypothetical protein